MKEHRMTYEDLVREFHRIYKLPIGDTPELPDDEVRGLRRALILEEVTEYMLAEQDNDIIKIADALADLVYVAIGAAISYGIPFDEIFNEVQKSNMSKLGEDGLPIYADYGKVLKGPNFVEPDIKGILER